MGIYEHGYVLCGLEDRDNDNLFTKSFNARVVVGNFETEGPGLMCLFADGEQGAGNENEPEKCMRMVLLDDCSRWDIRRNTTPSTATLVSTYTSLP